MASYMDSHFGITVQELWIEQAYRNGVPHGTTNYYEKSGSLHKSEQWWRGRFIGPGLEEGDTWQGYLKWTLDMV